MRHLLVTAAAISLISATATAKTHGNHITAEDLLATQNTGVASMVCSKWIRIVSSSAYTDEMRIQSASVANQLADTLAGRMSQDFRDHQDDPRKGDLLISTGVFVFCQSHPTIIVGDAVIDTVGVLDGKGTDPYGDPQDNPVMVAP